MIFLTLKKIYFIRVNEYFITSEVIDNLKDKLVSNSLCIIYNNILFLHISFNLYCTLLIICNICLYYKSVTNCVYYK